MSEETKEQFKKQAEEIMKENNISKKQDMYNRFVNALSNHVIAELNENLNTKE